MKTNEKIKYYRIEAGYTQSELAKKIGYSRGYLATIESGKNEPSIELIQKVSEALHIPIESFLSDKLEKTIADSVKDEIVQLLYSKTENKEIQWTTIQKDISDIFDENNLIDLSVKYVCDYDDMCFTLTSQLEPYSSIEFYFCDVTDKDGNEYSLQTQKNKILLKGICDKIRNTDTLVEKLESIRDILKK